MKIQKDEDQEIYVLQEKDVQEALIQYIENWENITVLPEIEYIFCGDELHIISTSSEAKAQTEEVQRKLERKKHPHRRR